MTLVSGVNVGLTFSNAAAVAGTNATTNRTPGGVTPVGLSLPAGTVLNVNGSVTSANTRDNIPGALSFGGNRAIVTVTPATTGQSILSADSLARNAGGAALFRGTALGTVAIDATSAVARSNIVFATDPTSTLLVGGGAVGGKTVGIIPWALGDATTTGLGTGLVTYDPGTNNATSAVGIRLLKSGEYATTISGAGAGENVLSSSDTVTASKTINSLQLTASNVTINNGLTLTITSGALTGINANILNASGGTSTINFGGATDAYISTAGGSFAVAPNLTGATNIRRAGGSTNTLAISGAISDNGATAANVIIFGPDQGTGTVLSSALSTYTGTTTLERGTLQIGANAPRNAPGALGNGATALVLGSANSSFNELLIVNLTNGVTFGRDVTSLTPVSAGGNSNTQRIRFGIDDGTTAAVSATISSSSTITDGAATGSARRFSFTAGTNDTLTVDALLQNGGAAASGAFIVNESGSGNSTGRVKFTNTGNSFAGGLSVSNGLALIGASVASGTGNSVVGIGTAVSIGDAGTSNLSTVGLLIDGAFNYSRAINVNNFAGTPTVQNYIIGQSGTGNANFDGTLTIATGTVVRNLFLAAEQATSNFTFTSAIGTSAGGVNVIKSGPGIVTLLGANTYAGTTAVDAGTLQVGQGGTLGTLGAFVGNGLTTGTAASLLISDADGGTTVTNTVSVNPGNGTNRTIGGTNTSGTNTFNSVTLTTGVSSENRSVNLTAAAGGTVNLAGGIVGGVTGGATGVTQNVTKLGDGVVTLGATSSYTGSTTVGAGTLRTGVAGAIPSGSAVTVAGNAPGITATLDLNNLTSTLASLTLGGATATSAAAVTTGTGTLTLGGNVTYSATSNPVGATISGSLALGGADRTFTVGDSSTAAADLTVAAVISGGNGVIKAGAGTLVFTNNNTYTGFGTSITAGILQVGDGTSTNGSVGSNTVFLDNNAAISLNKADGGTVGNLIQINQTGGTVRGDNATGTTNTYTNTIFSTDAGGTGTITSTNAGATLAFNATTAFDIKGNTYTFNGSGNTNVSGAIVNGNGGTGSIVKAGTGALTLGGVNTYAGTTTVNGGALLVNGSTNAASAVTVNNNGTLLAGTGTIGGSVTVNTGAGISPGSAGQANAGRLNTGALTLASGANFFANLNGNTQGAYDQINVTGTVDLTGSNLLTSFGGGYPGSDADILFLIVNDGTDAVIGTFASTNNINFISYTADFATGSLTGGNDVAIVPVPEPGTVAAGLLAFGTLGLSQRRRVRRFLSAKRLMAKAA